jgi:pyruvate dehydrogenase E1 component alpha subunit
MHISIRQPSDATARFAEANGIPFEIVDGNDVVTMERVGREAVERARSGGGPSYIEAITYRWYGHVDWRDDIDVGVNRSQADVASWKARDPIARLRSAMVSAGIWSANEDSVLQSKIAQEVDEAWEQALRDPYPSEESLLDRVYAVDGVKS